MVKEANIIGQFVGLAAVLAGIFLAVAFAFLVLSPENAQILEQIAWAFTVFGIVLAFFMFKTARK